MLSQNSAVPDSEASDEEQLIPMEISEGNDGSEITTQDTREFQVPCNRTEINVAPAKPNNSSYMGRMLRERTAIQKMPYSLDRIRHRQLLQGFDISNFDSVADTIRLPRAEGGEEFEKADNESEDTNEDTPFFESSPIRGSSVSNDYDEFDSLPVPQRHHNLHISDGDEEENGEPLNNLNIIREHHKLAVPNSETAITSSTSNSVRGKFEGTVFFRGRYLDLKRGYKGVLPKAAWYKALNEPGPKDGKKYDVRTEMQDRRGLAKRKTVVNRERKDNSNLILDFIGDDPTDEASDHEVYLRSSSAIDVPNNDKIRAYFDGKYGRDDLQMDGKNQGPELLDSESESVDDEVLGMELLTLNDEDFQMAASMAERNQPALNAVNFKKMGSSRDFKIIDFMLTKNATSKNGTEKTGSSFKKTSLPFKRNRRKQNTSRSMSRISIKDDPSLWNEKKKTTSVKTETDRLSWPKDLHEVSLQKLSIPLDEVNKVPCDINEVWESSGRNSLNQSISEKDKRTQRTKKSREFFSVPPADDVVLTRKAMTFSTVVEKVSDKFVFKNTRGRNIHATVTENEDWSQLKEYEPKIIPAQLFEALEGKSVFAATDVISLNIGSINFKISKLDQDGEDNLRSLLDHIVKFGASDEEIKNVTKLLTEFIYSWNSHKVYDTLNNFHREFRAKVNILRDRAKPIHFFLISVCQLMFAEISRYSNTSYTLKQQILDKITDHVSSYFKLLAKCNEDFSGLKDSLMMESLSILEFVILLTGTNSMLWEKLSKNKYPPKLALIMTSAFPTKKENWQIARVPSNYEDMSAWFQFIELCQRVPYAWTLTDRVILDLYEFFKNRRFEDFEEEHCLLEFPIVPNLNHDLRPSLFNAFLQVLSCSSGNTSLLEKMTPLSKIHDLKSVPLFANRLNLLLVLASKADYSFERRVEELFNQYFFENDLIITEKVFKAMLQGLIYFFQISKGTKVQIRGQIVVSLWKETVKNEQLQLDDEWCRFWAEIRELMPSLDKSRSSLLKCLHQILHLMVSSGKYSYQYSIFFNMYMENLEVMRGDWIQTHLMQLLLVKAKSNVLFLEHYCQVVKLMIERNVLTWWALFNFNAFTENDDVSLLYYSFLVRNCDDDTFKQVKLMLYQRTLQFLLNDPSAYLVSFLRALKIRDSTLRIQLSTKTNQYSSFRLTKNFLIALKESDYTSVFSSYLDRLKDLYLKNSTQHVQIERIVRFLNRSMIDIVRLLPSFIFLRSVFNINSEESENSALREHLKSLETDHERLLYLIERLIPSIQNSSNISPVLDILVMTIEDRCFKDELDVFCAALITLLNYCSTGGKNTVFLIFFAILSALNSFLDLEGSFIAPQNCHKLVYVTKQLACRSSLSQVSSLNYMLNEYHHFFYNVLRISYSFSGICDIKEIIISNLFGKTACPSISFDWKYDEPFRIFERKLNALLCEIPDIGNQGTGILGEYVDVKGQKYLSLIREIL